MKKKIRYSLLVMALGSWALVNHSCSLEEENPGGFTMETVASTADGYQALINQCYFAMERYFYGTDSWMSLTEGGTDLWTYIANQSTSYTQWFWYFAGAAPNTTYTSNWWNGAYDGIGSCNTAISLAHLAPFATEEERNYAIAQARFLRAIYYFNAVEQFGGVTVILEPPKSIDYAPSRTAPLSIYENIIIPDLQFAFQWLKVGDDNTTTEPTKKAALGFLAKACLQTVEYDETKSWADEALTYANMLIDDAESGGTLYNAYMYPTFDEVFAESNNWANKEALWKHRWYAGSDGHGSSNGNYRLNRNNEYFSCKVTNFGAIRDNQDLRLTWGGGVPTGYFMPTQHLLQVFVQSNGTLDPRFYKSFQTSWNANIDYTWDAGTVNKYDRDQSVLGQKVLKGERAIRFIMPEDSDYTTLSANKLNQKYLVVDYADIYNDAAKNVRMTYAYQHPTGAYTSDGTAENLFRYFYPSLSKHNSSRYYVADAAKMRNGNLNATFMMRMAEGYLIAAEADLYVNGGTSTMKYLKKVRDRAGALPLTGTPTIQLILDERARELCGEYCRFYDLKRTGMLKDATYLQSTHPDLATFFNRNTRSSHSFFLPFCPEGGGTYYQNPGY
jgi:hypothetical protein